MRLSSPGMGIRWLRVSQSRRAITALLAVGLLVAGASASANPRSDALVAEAYTLAYNLDQDQAVALFRQAIAADPADPAAYRGLAAVTWQNILFKRGMVVVDEYQGRVTRPNVSLPPPPPDQAALFADNVARSLSLCEKLVDRRPNDPSSHYQLGATVGLQASYAASVEGTILGALRAARRAYLEHERVLELDPRRKDAGLIVGTYRYAVSTLALPVRIMAYLVGFDGDRERGIQMIGEAAASRSNAQTDALFALVLIENRERRYDAALAAIRELQALYPRNRLLWLEGGATALRARRTEEADSLLSEGLARLQQDRRPRMFGEEALWKYKRGATRLLLGRRVEAEADLRDALKGEARNWVRGRAHIDLGKLADLAGDRRRAQTEFQVGIALCEKDGDSVGAAEGKSLLIS